MKHFQATLSAPQHKSKMGGGNFQILFWNTRAVNFSRALLLLFALTAFFSCSKSDVANVAEQVDQKADVSISKTEDGLLNVVITRDPVDPTKADKRDNECTFYEAMRFTEKSGSATAPSSTDNRAYVDVEFRLILIDKSTLARTPQGSGSYSSYTNVGGLNITWVGYTPLSTHWYAVEFNTCVLNSGSSYSGEIWVNDFWGDNVPDFHLYPWNNWEAAGYRAGPFTNLNPDENFTQCTLNNDCSVSP